MKKKLNHSKRDFLSLTATSFTAIGLGYAAWPFVSSMNPAADVLALSSVEIDLSALTPGQNMVVQWRGKPVFIRYRTESEIEDMRKTPLSDLKDPEKDESRVKEGHEKWLVMVGVCTHLGCIPMANQGDYNGWFCPCHGSQYDLSGRIRKGPAPTNMEVPEYEFISDTKIKIG